MANIKIPEGSLISYFSNRVKKEGGINLAQGIPAFQPPKQLLNLLAKNAYKSVHQYAPGDGNGQLLNYLEQHYQQYSSFQKSNFLMVQGVTEAVTLLYIYLSQKFSDNFSVMAFDPAYETYSNLPRIFNHKFTTFQIDNGIIDFQKLEKHIKKEKINLFFISSPGNPFGKIIDKDEWEQLISLSLKYNFYIIYDSVYQDLYFSEPTYIPLEKFNDRLFYVNSFSKKFSITGWRLGYLLASNVHIKNIKSIHDYTGLCAPSVLQQSLADYLIENNNGKEYVENLRINLMLSFSKLSKQLVKLGFEIPKIDGGYFIWAKLPKTFSDGFEFAYNLYEQEKVAIIPGIHFSKNCSNFVRFNIAQPVEKIEEACIKLKLFIKNHA